MNPSTSSLWNLKPYVPQHIMGRIKITREKVPAPHELSRHGRSHEFLPDFLTKFLCFYQKSVTFILGSSFELFFSHRMKFSFAQMRMLLCDAFQREVLVDAQMAPIRPPDRSPALPIDHPFSFESPVWNRPSDHLRHCFQVARQIHCLKTIPNFANTVEPP